MGRAGNDDAVSNAPVRYDVSLGVRPQLVPGRGLHAREAE
jgi:hypothetical protein